MTLKMISYDFFVVVVVFLLIMEKTFNFSLFPACFLVCFICNFYHILHSVAAFAV